MAFGEIQITVRDGLAKLGPVVTARAKLVLEKAARDVEARAKAVVPVDTGALKNSIQAAQEAPLTWAVNVGQGYGIYVEFGTHRMAARPYLTPAVEAVRLGFELAMGQVLADAAAAARV